MTALERASTDSYEAYIDRIGERDAVEQATRLAYAHSFMLGCTLSLLLQGYSQYSVAQRLGRTPRTVRTYTHTLRQALSSLL